jgi:hypothetical protein
VELQPVPPQFRACLGTAGKESMTDLIIMEFVLNSSIALFGFGAKPNANLRLKTGDL